MEPIRILIADDHTLLHDGLRALLNSVPDTEVVGEAAAGDEAIAQASELQPDVILMDIQMPGVNGIGATRRILHASPHIGRVLRRDLRTSPGLSISCGEIGSPDPICSILVR